MATGTQFEIGLGVSGAGAAASAADVMDRLASELEAAGAAATAAADAVKAGEAAYRQAENAADRAAKAVEKIGLAAEAQRGKMKAAMDAGDGAAFWRAAGAAEKLNQRQAEAVAKAKSAKAALDAEAVSLDKLKASADGASATQGKLAKAQHEAKKAAEATKKVAAAAAGSGAVNEMAEGFGKLGGPLGALGQKAFGAADAMKKLSSSMGSGGIYAAIAIAVVAIVTAVLALTAAAIAGTLKITAWAVGLADAARTQGLLTAGIAGSVEGGKVLAAQIDSLSSRVPQTSEELRAMAADLAKTGLKGDALAEALESAAVKAAEAKFGPDWSKQMSSIGKSGELLKKGMAGIFGGLNIEALLSGLSKIVAMFDATSVTGRAIKVVFESIFQPIVDGLAALAPKVVSTFIQFEIWALKALIAIKPFGSKIELVAKAFGILALIIGGIIAVVLVGIVMPFAALAGILTAVIAAVLWVSDAFTAFGKSVTAAGGPVTWLQTKFGEVVAFLQGINLGEIGKAMIDGLVQGITNAGGAILSAMTGAVSGAIDGAKKLLGIASPSKVFAEIGGQTGAGMVEGVEGSAAGVQSSLESMVAPPEAAPAGAAPAKGSGGSLNLAGATFIFQGVEGAEDAESRFGGLLTRLLEGDASQLGAEAPANA